MVACGTTKDVPVHSADALMDSLEELSLSEGIGKIAAAEDGHQAVQLLHFSNWNSVTLSNDQNLD